VKEEEEMPPTEMISAAGLSFDLVLSDSDKFRMPLKVEDKTRVWFRLDGSLEKKILLDIEVIAASEEHAGARAVISEFGPNSKRFFIEQLLKMEPDLTKEAQEDLVERIDSELTRRLITKPEK
jgi:hypothetical protein